MRYEDKAKADAAAGIRWGFVRRARHRRELEWPGRACIEAGQRYVTSRAEMLARPAKRSEGGDDRGGSKTSLPRSLKTRGSFFSPKHAQVFPKDSDCKKVQAAELLLTPDAG